MSILEPFYKKYLQEVDLYHQLAITVKDILEKETRSKGIKCIVTYRVKPANSLKEKLQRKNKKKQYQTMAELEKDILDIAGVRVALYFPSDRETLNRSIESLFEVFERKEFPRNPQKPKLNKRFSGYWATHYRALLKGKPGLDNALTSKVMEIQVASVLMHAWAEVEHDLVYKPLMGQISEDELAILDEINGLVMAGEIALERLRKAYTERIRREKEVTTKHELTVLSLNDLKNLDFSEMNKENSSFLKDYLSSLGNLDKEMVVQSFEKISQNFSENMSDQLLKYIIIKDYDRSLVNYLSSFTDDDAKVAAFISFLDAWSDLEKTFEKADDPPHSPLQKKLGWEWAFWENSAIFNNEEIEELKELRVLRNKILHGFNSVSHPAMTQAIDKLRSISAKIATRQPVPIPNPTHNNELDTPS